MSFAAAPDITGVLWNPTFHYRIHKNPQLYPNPPFSFAYTVLVGGIIPLNFDTRNCFLVSGFKTRTLSLFQKRRIFLTEIFAAVVRAGVVKASVYIEKHPGEERELSLMLLIYWPTSSGQFNCVCFLVHREEVI